MSEKFEPHNQRIFEHLEKDYSNVPNNIRDFKNKIGDLNPEYYGDIQNMFLGLANHSNSEVSKAANELLSYFNKEIKNSLIALDNRKNNLIRQEVMQAANNPGYKKQEVV